MALVLFISQHSIIGLNVASQIQMGSSHHLKQVSQCYKIQHSKNGLKTLAAKSNDSLKYLLKTFNTTSIDEHQKRLQYFTKYKAIMSENIQITQLVDILEERDENFCTHSYKLHLIFQHSSVNLLAQVQARRRETTQVCSHTNKQYFGYEDLCKIFYSCLSALWVAQDSENQEFNLQRKPFSTIFLKSENILIFEDGSLKVMDPYLIGYENRYTFDPTVNYSPQKLQDFHMADDVKSSIFELGMVLLELTLLQSNESVYSGLQFNQQLISQKLAKARELYQGDLEQTFAPSLFDIIQKMTARDRKKRFGLQQTIHFAEEMYRAQQEGPSKWKMNSSKKNISSKNKHELKLTNHSSSGKSLSPSLQKFYSYKKSTIQSRIPIQKQGFNCLSPTITNFAIEQVPIEKEESSMLESLSVQSAPKANLFSQSLLNGNVFSTIRLSDSYNYDCIIRKPSEQQIFTDPVLLMQINKQMEQIRERKLRRSVDDKSRQGQQRIGKWDLRSEVITNRVYLVD